MNNITNELVSVVVVSYNAENTIIETLESIKNQSYRNIELIVSDDCSIDRTVEISKTWINENRSRFTNVKLLTVEKNTGVCANGNRGRRAAEGTWLKGIAGDDILMPDCINDYMTYVIEHPETKFMTAYRRHYNETFEECNVIREDHGIGDNSIYHKSASIQLKYGVRHLLAQGATMFYAKEVFEKTGGFDPKYPYEDFPFSISALEAGFPIRLVPKVTVGYRVHQSICHEDGKIFNYKFIKATRLFYEDKCFRYLSPGEIRAERLIWKLEDFLYKHGLNDGKYISKKTYWKIKTLIRKILK